MLPWTAVLRRIGAILATRAKLLCWKVLSPSIHLGSGIPVVIRDSSDWDVFSEIFVNREYDDAILEAFSSTPLDSPIVVLDCGANVGYFSLRVLHLARLNHLDDKRLTIHAFEGNPNTFRALARNVAASGAGGVHPHLGLIGKRQGDTFIYGAAYSGANSVVTGSGPRSRLSWRGAYALPSSYFDVHTVVRPGTGIDLLKCDIEGSEADFLSSYQDLLAHTKRLIIEFHPLYVDIDSCQKLIYSAGLVHRNTQRQNETTTLAYFVRP